MNTLEHPARSRAARHRVGGCSGMTRGFAISVAWFMLILMFLIVVVTSSGCTAAQETAEFLDHGAAAPSAATTRSLTFDSPRLHRAVTAQASADGAEELPWYADRNDAKAGVYA